MFDQLRRNTGGVTLEIEISTTSSRIRQRKNVTWREHKIQLFAEVTLTALFGMMKPSPG
jgi:hypothetical protein